MKRETIEQYLIQNGIVMQKIKAIQGKAINTNYVLEDIQGRKYFLKRYSRTVSEKYIEKMKIITDYLDEKGISVPKIISTEHIFCDKYSFYLLMQYLKNDPKISKHNNLKKICEEINKMRDILKQSVEVVDTWMLTIHNIDKIVDIYKLNYGKKEELENLLGNIISFPIKEILNFLFIHSKVLDNKEMQLVHGDLNKNNILLNYDGKISFVDFDTLHLGIKYEDTATFALSMCFDETKNRFIIENFDTILLYLEGEKSEKKVKDILNIMMLELIKDLAVYLENWKVYLRFPVSKKIVVNQLKLLNYLLINKETIIEKLW